MTSAFGIVHMTIHPTYAAARHGDFLRTGCVVSENQSTPFRLSPTVAGIFRRVSEIKAQSFLIEPWLCRGRITPEAYMYSCFDGTAASSMSQAVYMNLCHRLPQEGFHFCSSIYAISINLIYLILSRHIYTEYWRTVLCFRLALETNLTTRSLALQAAGFDDSAPKCHLGEMPIYDMHSNQSDAFALRTQDLAVEADIHSRIPLTASSTYSTCHLVFFLPSCILSSVLTGKRQLLDSERLMEWERNRRNRAVGQINRRLANPTYITSTYVLSRLSSGIAPILVHKRSAPRLMNLFSTLDLYTTHLETLGNAPSEYFGVFSPVFTVSTVCVFAPEEMLGCVIRIRPTKASHQSP
ncbi:uncharacterized protein CLUP02_15344 [Colletotrichum lupini]|uniref:Uncharacterized protein n=1 Tax=Colletotrichum lupini TaxID=145971 RepID=A0A9Q8WN71_9PEZI|nr:uncharacterized protein CLUP02_15344 [Colletotrichum lupini]UQC89813.1 hypothetical protein CLUP02_15344 [Colletotrichum lupini]